MAPILIEQLQFLNSRVRAELEEKTDWARVSAETAELMSMAVHLFERMHVAAEKVQPPPPAWDEAAARPFVPYFKEWYDFATILNQLRKDCRAHGHRVEGLEDFLHTYNESKGIALHFEDLVLAHKKFLAGELTGKPLEQVMDELFADDRAVR